MKTIILCGGTGLRLYEHTETKAKPMVTIGDIPILIHIMNIYAHHGHKDFILCLGYKGETIKNYFLDHAKYNTDFSIDLKTGRAKRLSKNHRYDYKVTFVETGVSTNSAGRVLMASKYIKEDHFMVTYGDGVSDININKLINFHFAQEKKHKTLVTVSTVHPQSKWGRIEFDKNNVVTSFEEKKPVFNDYVNGGFQVFNKNALKFLRPDEMLEDSLVRVAQNKKLSSYLHRGFWHSMDTMKDYKVLNEMWGLGHRHWVPKK